MLIFPYNNTMELTKINLNKFLIYFNISKYLSNKNIFLLSLLFSSTLLYQYMNDFITDPYIIKVDNSVSLFFSFIEINLLFFLTLRLALFSICKKVLDEKFILISISGLSLAITCYTINLIFHKFIDVKDADIGNYEILKILFYHVFRFPFISLFSHIILFSPILLLVYMQTRKSLEVLQSFGLGFSLFLVFCIPLIFNNQTRHLLHAFPIYSLIFLKHLKIIKFNFLGLIMIQFLISFFYLSFYSNGEFNDKFFLSFFGFSMSDNYYPLFVLFGLFTLSFTYKFLYKP